jgi:transcriptional regulator GlxA family with amidase domain
MKQVTILVPEQSVIQAIADPQYCFSAVNQFLQASGRAPLFAIRLAGLQENIVLNQGLYTVHAQALLQDIEQTDLIIIPALFGNLQEALEANQAMIPWIQQQYQQGAEIASLCLGAFLLAATGLLNQQPCSTHWGFLEEFRRYYPDVALQDGAIVTETNRIYTSGGAHSYWNLLLHLVEKYTDRDTAILCAKYFAIDMDRNSQSAFAMFNGQKDHGDLPIREAQEFIEAHIDERLSVDALADQVAIGRRSFERRFKQATNNSVLEYIQRVKIETAKRQFERSRKNVQEVMFDVGYTDTKAFRQTFKKITGLTPLEYRNKYNKLHTPDWPVQA